MLIMEQALPNQMYLLKIEDADNSLGWSVKLFKKIILKDIPNFQEKVSMDFHFTNIDGGEP